MTLLEVWLARFPIKNRVTGTPIRSADAFEMSRITLGAPVQRGSRKCDKRVACQRPGKVDRVVQFPTGYNQFLRSSLSERIAHSRYHACAESFSLVKRRSAYGFQHANFSNRVGMRQLHGQIRRKILKERFQAIGQRHKGKPESNWQITFPGNDDDRRACRRDLFKDVPSITSASKCGVNQIRNCFFLFQGQLFG